MPAARPIATRLVALVAVVMSAIGVMSAPPVGAGAPEAEQQFVELINRTRAEAGLPPLTVHPELTTQSRVWAASMAGTGTLAHAGDISVGITAPWTVLGENVGVHGIDDVDELYAAFVASPGHYRNLVDERFRYVGVGVVLTADGELWTTHRFMATAGPEPETTAVPPTTTASTTAPPATTASTTGAPPSTTQPTTGGTPPSSVTEPTSASTTSTTGRSVPPSAPDPAGEPVEAGPGPSDLATVEQIVIDLVAAGL